jgi:hypothetical protein
LAWFEHQHIAEIEDCEQNTLSIVSLVHPRGNPRLTILHDHRMRPTIPLASAKIGNAVVLDFSF